MGASNEKTIVVLAFHRSMSSLTANLIDQMGIPMIPKGSPIIKNQENPKGFWEDQQMFNLNVKIIQEAGGTWARPPAHEAILKTGAKLYKEIGRRVEECRNGREQWGWKDPRTCLTLEVIEPHLPNLHCVFVYRQPEANFASFMKTRAGFIDRQHPRRAYNILFERYMHRAQIVGETYPHVNIFPDRLFSSQDDARKEIEKLAEFLFPGEDLNLPDLLRIMDSKHKHY
ncbi:MAG: hypothetical protein GY847_01395 [Proteobacteria bacterium]|nr:hypothetical protein [Pseudomonadota bacterium]